MLQHQFFCVRCQEAKTVVGKKPVVLKNGAMALKSHCPSCETTTYKIVRKTEAKKAKKESTLLYDLTSVGLVFGIGITLGAIIILLVNQY